ISSPLSENICVMPTLRPKITFVIRLHLLYFTYYNFISISTPDGRSNLINESTVCGVGLRMSIKHWCVRISTCSIASLYLCGDLSIVKTFLSVGNGIGPDTEAPDRFAVLTICSPD